MLSFKHHVSAAGEKMDRRLLYFANGVYKIRRGSFVYKSIFMHLKACKHHGHRTSVPILWAFTIKSRVPALFVCCGFEGFHLLRLVLGSNPNVCPVGGPRYKQQNGITMKKCSLQNLSEFISVITTGKQTQYGKDLVHKARHDILKFRIYWRWRSVQVGAFILMCWRFFSPFCPFKQS